MRNFGDDTLPSTNKVTPRVSFFKIPRRNNGRTTRRGYFVTSLLRYYHVREPETKGRSLEGGGQILS